MATNARLEELKKKFDENPRRYFAPLANEYRKQGDLTQAIMLCRAHLPNQPGHISGHIVLGQALFEARELPESRQIFEQALELDPENLIALRTLGDIANSQGDVLAARSWYERVLEADPRNDEIAGLLREIAAQVGAVPVAPQPQTEAWSLEAPPAPVVSESPMAARETETAEESAPRWDPDKTPVASAAIFESDSGANFAPRAELAPPQDSSDMFGDGVEDQGADLLEGLEPLAASEPEFVVMSETQVSEVAASYEVDAGTPELSLEPTVHEVDTQAGGFSAVLEVSQEFVVEAVATGNESTDAPADEATAGIFQADLVISGPESVVVDEELLAGSESDSEADLQEHESEAARFEEDSTAFTVAQHLSDPEAHPAQYSDEWFNAATPPRGVFQMPEPEIPATASSPQETFVLPTPATGSETHSTTVELDTFDLIENGRESDAANAPADAGSQMESGPRGESDVAPDAAGEHPAAWFDEPWQGSESRVQMGEGDGPIEPAAGPAGMEFDSPMLLEFESAPALEPEGAAATEFESAAAAEFESAAAAEFESAAATELETAAAAESEGAPAMQFDGAPAMEFESADADVAEPPRVEFEAEPEPVAIDRGTVGMAGPEGIETESAAVAASDFADPTLGHVVQEASAAESDLPEMFVTETMAELYLQQGFTEEALQVYRKLLERNPGDEGIRSRISALEAGAPSSVAEATFAAHAVDRAGQSVRNFFGRIARRQPTRRTEQHSALDVASLGAQLASRHGATDAPGEQGVSPTLTELFASAKRQDDDDAAAQRLAAAFGPPEAAGRPTRAADSELSLDHLFRDVPPESSGAVTLDAFFAASGGDISEASGSADQAGGEERTGDIEQFTAWLEGLKKK